MTHSVHQYTASRQARMLASAKAARQPRPSHSRLSPRVCRSAFVTALSRVSPALPPHSPEPECGARAGTNCHRRRGPPAGTGQGGVGERVGCLRKANPGVVPPAHSHVPPKPALLRRCTRRRHRGRRRWRGSGGAG